MSGVERVGGAEPSGSTDAAEGADLVRGDDPAASGPGLSDRDRKLLLLGALTQQNRIDDAADQMRAALDTDELTEAQLHEIAIFLCHYVGWPRGTSLDMRVGSVVGRWKKAARRAAEAARAEAPPRAAVQPEPAGPAAADPEAAESVQN